MVYLLEYDLRIIIFIFLLCSSSYASVLGMAKWPVSVGYPRVPAKKSVVGFENKPAPAGVGQDLNPERAVGQGMG